MYQVQYGGKNGEPYSLDEAPGLVVIRTRSRQILDLEEQSGLDLSPRTRRILGDTESVLQFRDAGVEVLRQRGADRTSESGEQLRAELKQEPDIQFAGRVLRAPGSPEPVVYTENLFIKFDPDLPESRCLQILNSYGLVVKRPLDYSPNAYFVGAKEGTGREVFSLAEKLLHDTAVQLCHPELIRRMSCRQVFPNQWHLKPLSVGGVAIDAHANVEAAWTLAEGQGTTIAIIDDGIDLEHEEFAGAGKIVAPRDATRRTADPRPGTGNNHGTACAGVACANGNHGASGVAPMARLMPIRLASGLGSQQEADAFMWAAQNGADVISCSWGPADGDPSDPTDPLHQEVVPLPDSTRLAIEWAVTNGRGGKGCVITFAAGNGNESVDNDGYASHPKVIAVAACNGQSQRSYYSDFGNAVWCSFPSSDRSSPQTPGIWTVDRSGAPGYNSGQITKGDAAGNYTNSFGGTSSACPGAAGVAALILSRNPALRWDEVRTLMRNSCDRIDPAGGAYDATGRSRNYGYGRLNARTAAALASGQPPDPPAPSAIGYRVFHKAVQTVPIPDLGTATLAVEVGDSKPVVRVEVAVDLEHTYIGDLIVRLLAPTGSGVGPITLHNRTGSGTDNLRQTFNVVGQPALAGFTGKSPQGTWTLEVQDKEAQDTGRILSFAVDLEF